jgi:hypothetical protein
MFRAHLKLLAALLILGIVAAAVVGMFYVWQNYLEPSFQARQEILTLEKDPPVRIDVGKREFSRAMERMKRGEVAAAHQQLSKLVKTYADSAAYSASRRILGEVNMDRLLSDMRTPGKKTYTVQSGDSLNKIASQERTTVDYIIQVNELQGITIQRGEQMIVCELDFSLNVSLANRTVTLLRKGKFFKEYTIRIVRGIRPADTKIEARAAFANDRPVQLGREGYIGSEKWLTCGKGVTFRAYTVETRDDEDLPGIFLDEADMEELYTILRSGTPVRVRN